MKSSVLTAVVENLQKVMRFIPERDELVKRVVADTLKQLREQAKQVEMLSPEEAKVAGLMGLTQGRLAVVEHPDIEAALTEVASATIRYYDLVDTIEGNAAAPTSKLVS